MKRSIAAGESGATAPGQTGGRACLRLAVLALVWPAAAQAQFSVQPVIVEMVTTDTAASAVLHVRNESSGPLQLRFYAADFDQPEEGGHVFMAPGTHPRSCASHLQFYPDGAALEAGEEAEIRVLMEPVDSTCWSMVFVESGSRSATGLSIAQRIGVKVYGVSGQERPEGEIRSVRVEQSDSVRAVVVEFANLGGGPVRPEGEIEIRTLDGDVAAVVPVAPFSVLPGRLRQTRVALDVDLAPGTYILVPILDFGADYLAGGQAMLEVPEP
jgi:hypothetical protein